MANMQRWEYMTMRTGSAEPEVLMDKCGASGWELVCALTLPSEEEWVFYFKRPLPGAQESSSVAGIDTLTSVEATRREEVSLKHETACGTIRTMQAGREALMQRIHAQASERNAWKVRAESAEAEVRELRLRLAQKEP